VPFVADIAVAAIEQLAVVNIVANTELMTTIQSIVVKFAPITEEEELKVVSATQESSLRIFVA
jgi:hypothetical protein